MLDIDSFARDMCMRICGC